MLYELKAWPEFFEPVLSGAKTFELRKDDRGFNEGDVLLLREFIVSEQRYTGRECRRMIVYKLPFGQVPGLKKGFCILSLVDLPNEK